MIGLVQQINKISHPEGNFAHRQFSVLAGDLRTSVCLLWWWMEAGGGLRYIFFDHINNSGDTGHPSWPDHLPRLHVLEQAPQVVAIFHFHLLTTWPCAFPRLRQMSSHSRSTSGLRLHLRAALSCILRWQKMAAGRRLGNGPKGKTTSYCCILGFMNDAAVRAQCNFQSVIYFILLVTCFC